MNLYPLFEDFRDEEVFFLKTVRVFRILLIVLLLIGIAFATIVIIKTPTLLDAIIAWLTK